MQIKMSVNLFHLLNDENTLVTTIFSKKENQMKNNGLSQPANKQHTPLPMAAAAAASTISTPSSFLCSSTQRRSTNYIFTSSLLLSHKPTLSTSPIPQLGLCSISSSSWDGLRKNMGIPIRTKFVKIVRKGRYTGKFYASLFGVGAPEALVIGVVALLVFGPKGLAEVARNLGKTLRAFQPTIRELQEVSREFKSTLEREIGLDDIPPSSQNTYRPPTTTASSSPTTTTASPTPSNADPENSEAVIDPNGTPAADKPANIGEFLVAAQIASQKNKTTPQEDQSESQPQATSTTGEVAAPDISTAPEVTSTAEVAATDISTAPEVASTVPEPRKLETEKDIPPSN